MKDKEEKEILRKADVLLMLGISPFTLKKYEKYGLPCHTPKSSNSFYLRSEIIAWIKGLKN